MDASRPEIPEWTWCVLAALAIWSLAVQSSYAQSSTVPAPWSARDIGSPTPAGSSSYDQSSGTFSIDAGGADIWGTSDKFHFVYQQVSGDVDVVARVDSMTQADQWSKSGVMIRASLAANSAHAFSLVSAGKGRRLSAPHAERRAVDEHRGFVGHSSAVGPPRSGGHPGHRVRLGQRHELDQPRKRHDRARYKCVRRYRDDQPQFVGNDVG